MTRRVSRRNLLRAGFGAALTAGLWPGALRGAEAESGSFRFICVNDLHCLDEPSGKWLESSVIPQMKATPEPVDFCLILGDLADKGTARELGMVRDAFKGLGIDVYAVPGNHDYAHKDDRKAYDEVFAGRLNYSFAHKGWQFVGLDSTQGEAYSNTSIQKDTLDWIDANTPKLDKKKPLVVFTHFPMGAKVTYRPRNAEDVLGKLADHNLQAVFGGHYHARTERIHREIAITTNACCSLRRGNHDKSPQKGYLICTAKEGKITREFVEVQMPKG